MKILPTTVRNFIKVHPLLSSMYWPLNQFLVSVFMGGYILKKKIFNFIDKRDDEQKLMINLGGGYFFRRHWKVLDLPPDSFNYLKIHRYFYAGDSPRKIALDYVFDLTSGKPFPLLDNSVAFFYSSHTLEHIPQEHCPYVLDEIFRCLKPGGAVRIMLPDFDLAYEAFAKGDIDFFNGENYPGACIEERFLHFFASYLAGRVSYEEVRKNFRSMRKEDFADYYTQQIPRKEFGRGHINWWNYEKLSKLSKQAGFENIYRSTLQQSHFIEMQGEGRRTGFDSTDLRISFIVEAIK